jgi:hypothetical protein
MENTSIVSTEKAVARVIVTAKGFPSLGEKGVNNLIKNCEKFLSSGKLVWAFGDYMGITCAGKGAGKNVTFMKQLEDNCDLDCANKLADLVPQVITKMADVSFALQIEKPALRAYFQPLLKARGEIAVTPEVSADNLSGLDKISESMGVEQE